MEHDGYGIQDEAANGQAEYIASRKKYPRAGILKLQRHLDQNPQNWIPDIIESHARVTTDRDMNVAASRAKQVKQANQANLN